MNRPKIISDKRMGTSEFDSKSSLFVCPHSLVIFWFMVPMCIQSIGGRNPPNAPLKTIPTPTQNCLRQPINPDSPSQPHPSQSPHSIDFKGEFQPNDMSAAAILKTTKKREDKVNIGKALSQGIYQIHAANIGCC